MSPFYPHDMDYYRDICIHCGATRSQIIDNVAKNCLTVAAEPKRRIPAADDFDFIRQRREEIQREEAPAGVDPVAEKMGERPESDYQFSYRWIGIGELKTWRIEHMGGPR